MELFFRKKGSGPALVVVHGLYGSSDNWMNMGKRLAENHTVYLIDQRNHGRSPFDNEHTYEAMVTDMVEFFEKHSIQKATILGHSMGGKTAMWFAANYPEWTEKLIIADIAPKNYLQFAENFQYHLHQNILRAMQEIDFDKIQSRQEVEDHLAERLDDLRTRQFLLKSITRDKKSKRYKWRLNAEVLYDYIDEIISGVNQHWFEDRMPITAYPVIFIRGLKSNYIKDEDIPLIKEIYPEATIIDIPGAGHWLHAEKPDQFMEAVVRCC